MNQLGDLLVVGLGNPGSRYAGTRHNVGSDAVVQLCTRLGERLRSDAKVSASTCDARVDGVRVHLAVPSSYMNESGAPVSSLIRRHEPESWDRVVVVHDELDLDPGVVRCKSGGGLAGHNGLRDIARHLGTQEFARVRIGVGKPPGGAEHGASWVLSVVSGPERDVLADSVSRAADAIEVIATEGLDAAMARFNARG